MINSFVRFEIDGTVGTITLDRPEKLNALDAEVLGQLDEALSAAGDASGLRCVILTGAGKAFVAGADIEAMRAMTPAEALEFAERGHRVFDRIERLPCPMIAAVNGFALGGGCELALACDFIYAAKTAKLGQPEVKLGVIPGFGGTQRLARRVGVAKARELIYTGRVIGTQEALAIGLVNAVFEVDALLPEVRKVADLIAAQGPVAVSAAKRVLLEGEDRPLPEANRVEREAFAACFDSADQTEGMNAFLEKRAPAFQGC